MKRALLGAALLLLAASCSKITSPTEPVLSGSGRLVTTVVESGSHAGIPNVTVEIRRVDTGAVVMNAVTNASGVSDVSLPVGGYSVRVLPPTGYAFVPEGRAVLGPTQFTLMSGTTVAMTVPLSKL